MHTATQSSSCGTTTRQAAAFNLFVAVHSTQARAQTVVRRARPHLAHVVAHAARAAAHHVARGADEGVAERVC
eukprot:409097-Pleurochrysis_carterae.AAC.2